MKKLFFMAAMSLLSCQLFAQIPAGRPARPAAAPLPPPLLSREVSGKVIDNTGQGVPGVNMILSSKSDTIKIATNADGVFVFHDVKQATFNINATSVGFIPYVGHFKMNDVAKRIVMDPITLKDESKELTTVNINGTPSITYKTDTVEYRASDYKVRENSTVDELLKHMEGFEVGSDGSVTHQGQAISKARLNGKDYAGGNLAQAIQNLPADIVEKIQVVDDYGDQAARTGIKDGDPTKVLNITTLANKSIGNVYRFNASDGTEGRYDERLFYNRLNANEVISLIANLRNVVNGVASTGTAGQGNAGSTPGTTTTGGPSVSYRDQLSKTVQVNGSYSYTINNNFSYNNSNGANFTQLPGPPPIVITTIDTNNSVTRNNNYTHNATFDYEWQPDSSNYFRFEPTYRYSDVSSNTATQQVSQGLQNTTTASHRTSTTTTPNYGIVANYQYLWKHDHRQNISLQYQYTSTGTTATSNLDEHILYKNAANVPVLDSLVNRNTVTSTTTHNTNITLQYSKPLNKAGGPVQQYLQFNESYSKRSYTADNTTSNINNPVAIDSLSQIYKYSFTQGNFALQYNRTGPKSQLTLGARAITAVLAGDNIAKGTTTNHNDFYIIPVFRYQYQWSRTEQIAFTYQGNATEPQFQQIQPVPDFSQNPQSPVYGNPNLKPSFAHTFTMRFNDYIANSKFNFSLNSRSTITQDQIVNNNIITEQPITIGTKTAENIVTQQHFLNTDGAFSESVTYNVAKQLNDRRYNLEFNGTVNYNYIPTYLNNTRFHQTTWDVYQRFGPRINPNTSIEINPFLSFEDIRDFSTEPSSNPLAPTSSDQRFYVVDVEGKFYLGKERRFTIEYEVSKKDVEGITGYNKKPFVTNAYLDYEFFARKNGSLRLSAFDIFQQNVFLNHTQNASGYTNTLSNSLSRYFLVSFVLNLNKFSGTPQGRNGAPMRRRGDGSFIVD